MISENGTPDNINTNELDLNNGGWILIGILIGIIVILSVLLIIKCVRSYTKTYSPNKTLSNDITDSEKELISQFRKLSPRDKKVITDTISTLSGNIENISTNK